MAVPAVTSIRVTSLQPGRARLDVAGVAGATSYKVYRDPTANPTTLLATLTPASTGAAVRGFDATVTAGSTYHYRVKSHNADGDSDYSVDVQFKAEAAVTDDAITKDPALDIIRRL